MRTIVYPLDYEERLRKYNEEVKALEEKRRLFYDQNPNFPIKTLYMNVCAPPCKLVIIEID